MTQSHGLWPPLADHVRAHHDSAQMEPRSENHQSSAVANASRRASRRGGRVMVTALPNATVH